jgi:periplasmic protein TonB
MALSPGADEQANFLGGCLIESDLEFEKRARKIKRHALGASIVVQLVIVAALVLFPLLSKGENIAGYTYTPMPPYRHGNGTEHRQHTTRPPGGQAHPCRFCAPPAIPNHIVTLDHTRSSDNPDPGEPNIPGSPDGQNIPGALGAFTAHREPAPPPPLEHAKPRTLQVSAGVQAARLIHRIEPTYPPLAKQIHREGRVELRAIIATDGRIKFLEVVSGEPFFIPCSLSAVAEWRYQPTLLNGEPVEVETHITVIYTLNH